MPRREWTDALCRRLSDEVAREAPTGLGHWEPAWQRVEAPSRALLEALSAFEGSGRTEDKQAAVRLAGDVLLAWRSAAAEWEQAGKPLGMLRYIPDGLLRPFQRLLPTLIYTFSHARQHVEQ